jgi:hypothetical protein
MDNEEKNFVQTVIAIYSSNMKMLGKFYEEALDLKVLETGEGYICLGKMGIEVNILEMNGKPGKAIEVEKEFRIREETPIKCSFLVSSLDQVKIAIEKYGGNMKNEEESWEWRETKHIDGYDPEGNVVQFRVVKGNK